MSKNVMIPLPLLDRIIELLDCSKCRRSYCDYDEILYELTLKRRKIKLREAYSEIVLAADTDARDEARIRYLREKRLLDEEIYRPF